MDIKEYLSDFWMILTLLIVIYIIFLKFKINGKIQWLLYYIVQFGLVIFVNIYIVLLYGGMKELLTNPLGYLILILFNLFYIYMLVKNHFKKRT